MATFVLVMIVLVLVGGIIWAKYSAAYSLDVASHLPPAEAAAAATSCFMASAHKITQAGGTISITPKLKRKAPTLHVEVSPEGPGSRVRMHADYISEKRAFTPWIPMHGTWIWRKQRKIATRITTPTEVAAA